jgi:hypothetical protein
MRASPELVEVEDICAFDPVPQPVASGVPHAAPAAEDDTVEIELTAEQMDALLSAT